MLRMMIRFMLLLRMRGLIMYDMLCISRVLYSDNASSRNLRWQIGIVVF